MSTKRLTRTVVEGGRGGWNKWERRFSIRSERARVRAWLCAVLVDPEIAEDRVPPKRDKVYKGFDDKLGAAERWLMSRVGRPWRDVEGEILRTFDTRSLMGRHIVFDHLLPWSWLDPRRDGWRVNRRGWFWVGAEERLCFSENLPPTSRWARYRRRVSTEPHFSKRVHAFVGDRRIGSRDDHLYWLIVTSEGAEVPRRRQGRELTDAERATWESFTARERRAITIALPQ